MKKLLLSTEKELELLIKENPTILNSVYFIEKRNKDIRDTTRICEKIRYNGKAVYFFMDGIVYREGIKDFVDTYRPVTREDIKKYQLSMLIKEMQGSNSKLKYRKLVFNKIIKYFGEDRVHIESSSKVVIWFPEITVTNSIGLKWVIRDVFAQLRIDSDAIELHSVYRTTYTEEEVRYSYITSHSSPGVHQLYSGASLFCFGNVELSLPEIGKNCFITTRKALKNIDLFLYLLEEFFTWESLIGVPYKYIEKLITGEYTYKDSRRLSASDYPIGDMTKSVLLNIDNIVFDYTSDNTVILNTDTQDLIKNYLNEKYPESKMITDLGGRILEKLDTSDIRDTINRIEKMEYKFKDRIFTGTVLPSACQIEYIMTIPKDIITEVYNNIVKLLKNFIIKQKIENGTY
jgi:hypothetical protein